MSAGIRVLLLGATGRTGRLVAGLLLDDPALVGELVVLVRDPARLALPKDRVVCLQGSSTDGDAVRRALPGVAAVVSALGPTRADRLVCSRTAAVLVPAMTEAGIARYVGISGAAVPAPGDRRGPRDRLITAIVAGMGGAMARDKAAELRTYMASDLLWTLARPGRLLDGPAVGHIRCDAHQPQGWRIRRADLAQFLVDQLRTGAHVRQAPFVAG